MGRFYKTSKPEMLDFMYKIPEQAIMTAVKSVDTQLDTQGQLLTDLKKYLQANVHASDDARKNEIIKEAEKKIMDYTLNLHSTPLAALNKMGEVRQFGQELHENYTRGELGNMINMKKAEDDWVAQESERVQKEKGQVLPQDVESFKRVFRNNYDRPKYDANGNFLGYEGGLKWDAETKKGKGSYMSERMANYVDAQSKVFKLTGENWKPDAQLTHNTFLDGEFIKSTVDGSKVASYNEIYEASVANFYNDPEIKGYYAQRLKYGLMHEDELYGRRYKEGEKKGQLIPIMTKDEKGNEVPMQDKFGNEVPVYGGLIHEIATANAKRLGFVDTEKGIKDLKESEARKQRLIGERERETWLMQNPVAGLDVKDNMMVNLNGVDADGKPIESFDALNDDLSKKKTDLNSQGTSMLANITNAFNRDGKNSSHVKPFTDLWETAQASGSAADWEKVDQYLTSNSLLGVDVEINGKKSSFGTGVKQYISSAKSLQVQIQNQQQYVDAATRDAVTAYVKEYYKDNAGYTGTLHFGPGGKLNSLVEQTLAEYKRWSNNLTPSGQATSSFAYSGGEIKKLIDGKIAANSKKNVTYDFFGVGEITQNYASGAEAKGMENDIKENSKPGKVLSVLMSTGAMLATGTQNGKTVTETTSGSQILNEYGFSGKETESDDGMVYSDNGQFAMQTSTWSVSPDRLNNQGVNGIGSKRMTLTFFELKDGKPTSKKISKTIIVSGEDVKFSPSTENVIRNAAADAEAKNFDKKAKTMYAGAVDNLPKEQQAQYSYTCEQGTGTKIYPATNTYKFSDGREFQGEDGKRMYAELLREKNVFGANENSNVAGSVKTSSSRSTLNR
jgi:hypothetical protein